MPSTLSIQGFTPCLFTDTHELESLIGDNNQLKFIIDYNEFLEKIPESAMEETKGHSGKGFLFGYFFTVKFFGENTLPTLELAQLKFYKSTMTFNREEVININYDPDLVNNTVKLENEMVNVLFTVPELKFIAESSGNICVSVCRIQLGHSVYHTLGQDTYYTLKLEGDNSQGASGDGGDIPAIVMAAPCPPIWRNPGISANIVPNVNPVVLKNIWNTLNIQDLALYKQLRQERKKQQT